MDFYFKKKKYNYLGHGTEGWGAKRQYYLNLLCRALNNYIYFFLNKSPYLVHKLIEVHMGFIFIWGLHSFQKCFYNLHM